MDNKTILTLVEIIEEQQELIGQLLIDEQRLEDTVMISTQLAVHRRMTEKIGNLKRSTSLVLEQHP